MIKWEYLTIELEESIQVEREPDRKGRVKTGTVRSIPQAFTQKLNIYGQEGWELVTIFYYESTSGSGSWGTEKFYATLKRVVGG